MEIEISIANKYYDMTYNILDATIHTIIEKNQMCIWYSKIDIEWKIARKTGCD